MASKRALLAAVVPLLSLPLLGGCFAGEPEMYAAPPPPPPPAATTVIVPPGAPAAARVVTYAEGRWELRGDGTTVPYSWVWVPAGVTVSAPPAPPTAIVVSPSLQRTVTYPTGRYELRGDGATVPYYWVWIPAGANPPWPPNPHPRGG